MTNKKSDQEKHKSERGLKLQKAYKKYIGNNIPHGFSDQAPNKTKQ